MRRRLRCLIYKVRRKSHQRRKSHHRRQTQRRQRPLVHSTSAKRNGSNPSTTLGKRRHPQRQNETRLGILPSCLRFQSAILYLPTRHPTRPFRLLARANHEPHHQTLTEIARHKQRTSTHGATKSPIYQVNTQPRSCHLARHHTNSGTQQPMNERRLRHHPVPTRSTKILLRSNRQVPHPIFARL